MRIKLSPDAFVRQYGPYSYIVNSYTSKDFVFSEAQSFLSCLHRTDVELSEVINGLKSKFTDVNEDALKQDFLEFLSPLIREKMVYVDGKKPEAILSADAQIPCSYETEAALSTRDLLDKYFENVPTLFTLQLDISQACTERCIHCYVPRYMNSFLPFEKIKLVIDEFRQMGGLVLSLSGGECMLHPRFKDILSYAHLEDIMIKVLSNLILCDSEMVTILKDVGAEVQTSLYSTDPEIHDIITQKHGSCASTKRALEDLREANVPCVISCPIMRANQDQYPNVREYAKSLGCHVQADFMIIAKMDGDTRNLSCRLSDDKIEATLKYLAELSLENNKDYFSSYFKEDNSDKEWLNQCLCSAGVSRICLGADGNYFPCPGFGGYVLGNCFKHSLDWVWHESPNMLKIRRLKGRDLVKCVACQNRKYCSICLCRNFNETGDMLFPTEFDCNVARINRRVVEGFRNT